jgi:hypothetical protein
MIYFVRLMQFRGWRENFDPSDVEEITAELKYFLDQGVMGDELWATVMDANGGDKVVLS